MRREDREIKELESIIEIINRCQVLIIGLIDDGYPYVVPVNFAFDEKDKQITFYFHSALSGRKIDLINKNNNCSFTLYNDLGIKNKKNSEEVTNYYESVMGIGKIEASTDLTKKREIAKKLLEKYGYAQKITVEDQALERTYLAKIIVESISGKANREE
jgi:nitroimidazol reductase NimA-like FMN-containing flavoprotein (pyridoxamine 5'-phosphate oxidase superfamily)